MRVYVLEFPTSTPGLYRIDGIFKSYEAARDYCKQQFSIIPRSDYKRPMNFVETTENEYSYFCDTSCLFLGTYRGHWEAVKE